MEISTASELSRHKERIAALRSMSEEFRTHVQNIPDKFVRRLSEHGAPPPDLEDFKRGFGRAFNHELLLEIRDQDIRYLGELDKLVSLLQREIGGYAWNSETRRYRFESAAAQREYAAIREALAQSEARQSELVAECERRQSERHR